MKVTGVATVREIVLSRPTAVEFLTHLSHSHHLSSCFHLAFNISDRTGLSCWVANSTDDISSCELKTAYAKIVSSYFVSTGIRKDSQGGCGSQEGVGLENDIPHRVCIEVDGCASSFFHFVCAESVLNSFANSLFQNDTQLVSILYRTHKSLPTPGKVSSLYAFDALARAARSKVTKYNLTGDVNSEKGNCATFLLKIEGVLDGLFQDMVVTGTPETRVSFPP